MKKIRWLCFIPFWGALIYIILVIIKLSKTQKGMDSMVIKHLFVLVVLSFANIVIGMFIVSLLLKLFSIQIDNVIINNLIVSLQVCLFAWPAIAFIAIKLDKKIEIYNSKALPLSNEKSDA